jgi:hypothetical protein
MVVLSSDYSGLGKRWRWSILRQHSKQWMRVNMRTSSDLYNVSSYLLFKSCAYLISSQTTTFTLRSLLESGAEGMNAVGF